MTVTFLPSRVSVRPSSKSWPPKCVAHYYDVRAAALIFFAAKSAAAGRQNAQGGKEIRRNLCSRDSFGRALDSKNEIERVEGRDTIERLSLLAYLRELGERNRGSGRLGLQVGLGDRDQPLGTGVWQGLEQDGIDHAEDRGVGANAQAECEHRDDRESQIAPQNAQSIDEIADRHVEHPAHMESGKADRR